MEKKYTLKVAPRSTPRPRIGRWGMYSPPKYKEYMDLLIQEMKIIKPHEYTSIDVVFKFEYPKSASKKSRIDGAPHRKKPDCDNLVKAVCDALVKTGVLSDDSILDTMKIKKVYTTSEACIELNLLSGE